MGHSIHQELLHVDQPFHCLLLGAHQQLLPVMLLSVQGATTDVSLTANNEQQQSANPPYHSDEQLSR